MKNYRGMAGLATPALLVAGYLMIPTAMKATDPGDSVQVTKLSADAKAEAVELKRDSADMESFTESKPTWESYAHEVGLIKEHVNNAGKLLANLQTSPVEQNKKGDIMKGFVQDIEGLAIKNDDFRRVLYTAKHCQLVVMALKPKEEIGAEVHKLDQFFRVEEGTGEAVLDGVRTAIRAGFAVVVPAGVNHNIINTGNVPLKLYTLYAPPNHRDGVVHHTRADAEADNEHFDGKTTQ
jgi:mannose-6-phosphate isomerase-like protein (cupin superfamily)